MNEKGNKLYFLTPLLLSILMGISNFLNTDLFKFGELNFAVWFILSVFSFACGWLINKTLNWKFGGRIVFAVTVATTIVSVSLISFFREYFGSSELLAENLILYSLRNAVLGCMGFFGMTVAELLSLQNQLANQDMKLDAYAKMVLDAKKEAELELKNARIKSDFIIREAEFQAKRTLDKKERIEKELKEFIQIEKELIKKYEDDD
ncbi:MAG: hypothetical protein WCJ01_00385 [Ignavibacteria bacterium]